jgi:transcriptional regulator
VPSWNYIAVHVRGRPRLFPGSRPELIEALLHETVAEYESRRSTPWPYDPEAQFHSRLARAVAGFEIEIDEIAAAFKLSQDKPEPDRLNVIAALAASDDGSCRAIGRLMADELDGVGAFVAGSADIPDAPSILLADEGERP